MNPIPLGAVCGFGLSSARRALLDAPVDHQLLSEADRHRVVGLLDAHQSGQHNDVAARHRAWLNTCLDNEAGAVRAIAALTAAGVDTRLLKGVAAAHLDYPHPSWRHFGDVDVLIRRADYATALQVLAATGWVRRSAPVRPWWERRWGKSIELTGDRAELDLHLTIAGGYFGLAVDEAALWADGQRFSLGGVRVAALSAPWRLVHACYHSVLGAGGGYRSDRDVAQLIDNGVDWRVAIRVVSPSHGVVVVATGIRQAWQRLGLTTCEASEWAAQYQPTERDRRRLAASAGSGAPWHAEGRVALEAIPRHDRVAYLGGLMWPSVDNLASRGMTRRAHLRRLLARRRDT